MLYQTPANDLTLLTTAFGRPFTPAGFGNWFRDCCGQAGLSGLAAHGLRKAAARRLAEAGCTVHQIASVTGHKTLKEVARYTAAADQERLAVAAIGALSGPKGEQELANPDERLTKLSSKSLKKKGI